MNRAATIHVAALVLAVTVGLGWALTQPAQPTIEQLSELHFIGAEYEAFYALLVWAWQVDPLGLFADWDPRIAC